MTYLVTGYYAYSTRRFRRVYSNRLHALCINLWRGNVWEVNETGKRRLIKRVYN